METVVRLGSSITPPQDYQEKAITERCVESGDEDKDINADCGCLSQKSVATMLTTRSMKRSTGKNQKEIAANRRPTVDTFKTVGGLPLSIPAIVMKREVTEWTNKFP